MKSFLTSIFAVVVLGLNAQLIESTENEYVAKVYSGIDISYHKKSNVFYISLVNHYYDYIVDVNIIQVKGRAGLLAWIDELYAAVEKCENTAEEKAESKLCYYSMHTMLNDDLWITVKDAKSNHNKLPQAHLDILRDEVYSYLKMDPVIEDKVE